MREHATGNEVRRRYFADAAAMTPFLAVEAEGLTFLVSTADEAPGGRLFVSRNRSEFAMLHRACDAIGGARGVFLDVGANIGTTSLAALSLFERAVAVEPEPLNAALLRANAALNRLEDRVSVHEAACSDAAGEVWLRLSPRKHGGHAVKSAKKGTESIQVPAVTIDGVLELEGIRPGDVGLLWMDVEGHEDRALAGAPQLMAAGVPIVVEARLRTARALTDVLRESYSSFLDLREDGERMRIEELGAYLEHVAQGARRRFTDVLVLPD